MAQGLGFIEFSTGDVLSAAAANGYLASQAVMVFNNSAARTSAITTPYEGMVSYLKDTNAIEYYSGSAWVAVGGGGGGGKVLQVVSATTSTSVSNSTTTPADTGLTCTITPTLNTSKILVMISQPINTTRSSDQAGGGWSLLRGATIVYDQTGSSAIGTLYLRSVGSNTSTEYYGVNSMVYLDSPATTSATTYKTQQRVYQAVSSANVTSQSDGATSSIVLMEIGA